VSAPDFLHPPTLVGRDHERAVLRDYLKAALAGHGSLVLIGGEAATCAVAIHRGMAVVMDERKGRRVLAAAAPTVTTHRTLDLVRYWAESKSIPLAEIVQVLRAIRECARFFPGRTDPNKEWWDSILPL